MYIFGNKINIFLASLLVTISRCEKLAKKKMTWAISVVSLEPTLHLDPDSLIKSQTEHTDQHNQRTSNPNGIAGDDTHANDSAIEQLHASINMTSWPWHSIVNPVPDRDVSRWPDVSWFSTKAKTQFSASFDPHQFDFELSMSYIVDFTCILLWNVNTCHICVLLSPLTSMSIREGQSTVSEKSSCDPQNNQVVVFCFFSLQHATSQSTTAVEILYLTAPKWSRGWEFTSESTRALNGSSIEPAQSPTSPRVLCINLCVSFPDSSRR